MPFTVAHAAVAPPLSRWTRGRLPVSALVVGSMAPDFEYLVFLQTRRTIGHTPLGLFVFCLPVSLLVLLLWHHTVKAPLMRLLPDRWGHLGPALDAPSPFRSRAALAMAALAVVLGSATHIAWDSFTHAGGAPVARLALLRTAFPVLGIPAYKALQYASGVLGCLFLAVCAARWARRQPDRPVTLPPVRARAIAASLIVATSLAVAAANVTRIRVAGVTSLHLTLIAAVLGAMAGGALAVLGYALTARD